MSWLANDGCWSPSAIVPATESPTTITFGGQFRYNQLVEYNLGSNGNFNFNGAETGVDFADFLIGAPQSYSQGQGYPSYGRSRSGWLRSVTECPADANRLTRA